MPTINELSKAAYANSKAHGFWDGPRNKGEMIALIHSELSEALEGIRKERMDDHLPQYKMEHVELADAAIRIFDYLGGFGLRWQDGETQLSTFLANSKKSETEEEINKGECIAEMHNMLSAAYMSGKESSVGPRIWLRHAALLIFGYAAHFEIDLETIIAAKMAYNAARPFMHGKKF